MSAASLVPAVTVEALAAFAATILLFAMALIGAGHLRAERKTTS